MTELEQQLIASRLAEIDRRRAEIEAMLTGLPHSPNACDDCVRHDLEVELRSLCGQGRRYPTAADSRVAFHEAGHAVIARKLGLSCGMVTLEPAMNGPKAEIAWRYYPKRPNATQEQANAAFAIAMYAGREAERMICGEPEEGTDRHDRELAHDAVGDDPGLESELRAWAAAMVQEHRETIEWFARALLQSGTLIPLEADSLVAQLSPPGEHWLHDV